MKWNPFVNGLGAAAYIGAVALLIKHISDLHHDTPDTVIGSIAFLSLVVFSAAVMGFLFFYRPVMLLIENRKDEAALFFLKTLGTFGILGALALLTLV